MNLKVMKKFKSKIIAGDVLKVLKKLDRNNKFDVIIADPPYNIGKDFGNNIDYMELQNYTNWSKNWIEQCLELLENNGLIYVYGFSEILARVASQFPLEEQRFLIWHYSNKTSPSSNFWQRSHEAILCLWKNKRPNLEINYSSNEEVNNSANMPFWRWFLKETSIYKNGNYFSIL